MYKQALTSIQSPKWVPGILFARERVQDREPNHSHPISAEVKNAWSYTLTPHAFSCRGNYAQGRIYPLLGPKTTLLVVTAWRSGR